MNDGEQYIGVRDLSFRFWSVTERLRVTLGTFCHKLILQSMKKGKAIKLCIISLPFLAPFTHHKSLPPHPKGPNSHAKRVVLLVYII